LISSFNRIDIIRLESVLKYTLEWLRYWVFRESATLRNLAKPCVQAESPMVTGFGLAKTQPRELAEKSLREIFSYSLFGVLRRTLRNLAEPRAKAEPPTSIEFAHLKRQPRELARKSLREKTRCIPFGGHRA